MSLLVVMEALQVSYKRANRTILRDISLSIEKGEFVGLIGPNGAGKTTLLKLLAGLLPMQSGQVFYEGVSISQFSMKQRARLIGYMPQTTNVAVPYSAQQIVMMGRYSHLGSWKREKKHDYEIVKQALEDTGTFKFKDREIQTLSGGERQLVFLARTLAQETNLLFLDEPTSDLDLHHQVQVVELLRKLTKKGKTVLATIHDLNLAARSCDRLALLHNGRILMCDAPEKVLTQEKIYEVYGTKTYVYHEPYFHKLQMVPDIKS
jgi:iron complex transport system ATP-binding protein